MPVTKYSNPIVRGDVHMKGTVSEDEDMRHCPKARARLCVCIGAALIARNAKK
jgi:hypothetical protein